LEELHQKPLQMERIRWEGQNFPEVVAPEEEDESVNMPNCTGLCESLRWWIYMYIYTQIYIVV
jgi:hypothetical protein